MALVTAIVVLGVVLSVGTVVLLSRANRGRHLSLWSSRGVRTPLSSTLCYLGGLAAFVLASREAAGGDGSPIGSLFGFLGLLLVTPQLVGRVWHNRRLPDPQDEDRRGPAR